MTHAHRPARRATFFQPGHTYATLRFRFRCEAVDQDPTTGEVRASGQHGTRRHADGEWIWSASARTRDDWSYGHWTDITESSDGR